MRRQGADAWLRDEFYFLCSFAAARLTSASPTWPVAFLMRAKVMFGPNPGTGVWQILVQRVAALLADFAVFVAIAIIKPGLLHPRLFRLSSSDEVVTTG